MKPLTIVLIAAVSIGSIGLNILLKKTADKADNFVTAVLSQDFAVAFFVGTCTALLMLAVYLMKIDLARAILLMGALSILGGAVVGVVLFDNRLDAIEWGIFGLLAILYAYRLYKVFENTYSGT